MRYVEAPAELAIVGPWQQDTLFLAGGITGCPDWQSEVVENLKPLENLTILNPRRANFPIDDPNAAQAQIEWEARHLKMATVIMFWFPKESICPISLYELGAWTNDAPLLFVGTDEDYARRQDVIIQTRLRKRDQPIYYRLDQLIGAVRTALTIDIF